MKVNKHRITGKRTRKRKGKTEPRRGFRRLYSSEVYKEFLLPEKVLIIGGIQETNAYSSGKVKEKIIEITIPTKPSTQFLFSQNYFKYCFKKIYMVKLTLLKGHFLFLRHNRETTRKFIS